MDQSTPQTIGKQHNTNGRVWFVLSLLLIAAAAMVIRLLKLGAWSLWLDEVHTIRHSITLWSNWPSLIPRSNSYNLPMLGMWLQGIDLSALGKNDIDQFAAAGISEFVIRLPTAILGGLSVLILPAAARRLIGSTAAIILACLLALATWHIWMSQTARFYADQFLFYNLALLAWLVATDPTRQRTARWWIVLAAVSLVLAFFAQVISLMLVGLLGIDWLVGFARKRWRRLDVFGFVAMTIGTLVCLGTFTYSAMQNPDRYAEFFTSSHTLPQLTAGMVFLISPMVCVAAAGGMWLCYRKSPRLVVILTLAAAWPLLSLSAVHVLTDKPVHVRYLFVALFPCLMLAAMGLGQMYELMRQRWSIIAACIPTAIVIAALLVTDLGYFTAGHGYRRRWKPAAHYVQDHYKPGDKVVLAWHTLLPGRYYLAGTDMIDAVKRPRRVIQQTRQQGHRVWVIALAGSTNTNGPPPWLPDDAQIESYYATHVLEPHSVVDVYRLEPLPEAVTE